MDADLANSPADDERQFSTAGGEHALTVMDLDTAAAVTSGKAASPPAIFLHVRDPTINCVCPLDTQPLVRDLIMIVTKEKGVTWLHRPCKTLFSNAKLLNSIEGPAANQVSEDIHMEDAPGEGTMVKHGVNGSVRAFSAFMGPKPSATMLTKLKNFTTKFLCDCQGDNSSTTLENYFMCKKCLAWQHKECMIYGEEGDHGGPVCNHCYLDFLAHYEEIDRWQRRRLMEAVQEAVMFMTDPETSHEVWRREWCKNFIRRFFAANKGLFVRFVTGRRRAQRIAHRMGIYDPAYRYFPRNHFVKRQTLGMEVKEEIVDEDDGENDEAISLASSDNIIVRKPRTKTATKSARPMPRVRKPSPLLPDGTKRPHKKKEPESKKRQAKDKKQPRKRQRRPPPPPSSESEEPSQPSLSDEEERSPSPVRRRKGKGPCQLIGASTARKSVRMSEVMNKPRYLIDSEGDEINETEGEDEDEVESEYVEEYELKAPEPIKYDPNSEGYDEVDALLHRIASGNRRGREPPSDADSQTSDNGVCCGCNDDTPSNDGSFRCSNCGLLQHKICALSDQRSLHPVCNLCHRSPSPPVKPMPAARRSVSTNMPVATTSEAEQPLGEVMIDEIHRLCSGILWTEYESLPSPNDDDDDPAAPSRRAPQDWLAECEARLTSMLVAAGPEQTKAYLGPVLKTFPIQADPVVKSLTEMAIWMRRKGPWRQKRDAFGLLGEILGLHEKGTYWAAGGFL